MFSPGQWHKLLPQDPIENVKLRIDILKKCQADSTFRRGIMEMCRLDIVFFISVFGWQYNPRLKEGGARAGPFICWDFQINALLDRPETTARSGIVWIYEQGRTGVVEKSRDMGASWLFLFFQVWLGLFHKNVQALDISRNADSVDHASPNSLFSKVRHIHENLPKWMLGEVVDQKMYFEYKRTKSFITGEASTSKAGVGGRASVVFVDEFSEIAEDTAVRNKTASTSDCRFFNSTHLGVGTEFFKLTETPEIFKIVMHWTQHPEKRRGAYRFNPATNRVEILDTTYEFPEDYKFICDGLPEGGPYPGRRSPWYDAKCVEIGSVHAVAEQLDINPTGSVSQFFEPLLIRKLVLEYTCDPVWEGDFHNSLPGQYHLVNKEGAKPEEKPFKAWIKPDAYGAFQPGIYKIGADVSSGTGATNSCLSIVNAETGERVAEYVNPKIYPEFLAGLSVHLCRLFKTVAGEPAQLIWEHVGPGAQFGKAVMATGFRNVYWNQNENLVKAFQDRAPRKSPGWSPMMANKILVMGEYQSALRSRAFLNRSKLALLECLLFQRSPDGRKVYHSGSLDTTDPSGAGDNHGDRVTADMLANKLAAGVAKEARRKEEQTGPPLLSWLWRREYRKQQQKRERAL